MGFPPRLNGKHTPLPSDETETCPNCHRKFTIFNVVNKGAMARRQCPYCDYKFPIKKDPPIKDHKRHKI